MSCRDCACDRSPIRNPYVPETKDEWANIDWINQVASKSVEFERYFLAIDGVIQGYNSMTLKEIESLLEVEGITDEYDLQLFQEVPFDLEVKTKIRLV